MIYTAFPLPYLDLLAISIEALAYQAVAYNLPIGCRHKKKRSQGGRENQRAGFINEIIPVSTV